jgi:hypothetical protein
MSADLAVGLFAAYGSILAIIVVYQTLMLQTRLGDAERLRAVRDSHNDPAELELDERARRGMLLRVVFESALLSAGYLVIASRALSLGTLVDAAELSPTWLTEPVLVLTAMFIAISAAYLVAVVRRLAFGR